MKLTLEDGEGKYWHKITIEANCVSTPVIMYWMGQLLIAAGYGEENVHDCFHLDKDEELPCVEE